MSAALWLGNRNATIARDPARKWNTLYFLFTRVSRIRDILRTSHILPLTRIRGSTNYLIRGNQQAPYEGIASCSGALRATCIIWEYARCENIIYFTVCYNNLLKYWIACYHLAAAMSHNYVHCKKRRCPQKMGCIHVDSRLRTPYWWNWVKFQTFASRW